jgi:hypothetical protein
MAAAWTINPIPIGGVYTIVGTNVDATPVAILNQPIELLSVDVDNSAYATLIYLNMWNNTTPVKATTAQDFQLPFTLSKRKPWYWYPPLPLSNGLAVSATTDAGTGATTDPGTKPTVYIRFKYL